MGRYSNGGKRMTTMFDAFDENNQRVQVPGVSDMSAVGHPQKLIRDYY